MPTAIAHLKSVSQYSQSRYLLEKKGSNEDYQAFEERIWRERAHIVPEGQPNAGHVFIPPMAFKQALDGAAKYAPIKKKGQQTYSKHFVSGVLCHEPLVLPMRKEDLTFYAGPMSSDGKKGSAGGSTVVRIYPVVPSWEGEVTFHIIDDVLTEHVFTETLKVAGRNIGIGRFRPQNGGFNGRFTVEAVKWIKD